MKRMSKGTTKHQHWIIALMKKHRMKCFLLREKGMKTHVVSDVKKQRQKLF